MPINVSSSDPVWTADKSTLSEMVGVPVRIRKYPPHPVWRDSRQGDVFENQYITLLFRAMDPEQDDFSFAPLSYLAFGSALVVRDDGKDITPQQVEALCYYSSHHTTLMFHDALWHRDDTGSNDKMLEMVALFTPQKFGAFFAEFKAKKMEQGASWESAVSPV